MTEMMYFTVPDISLWDLDNMNVNELVEWATAIRDQVPEQYREASKLDYETHDCGASLQVRWSRPKTAEDIELERREKERREREYEAQRHAREFAEYQRLKAKYEPAIVAKEE